MAINPVSTASIVDGLLAALAHFSVTRMTNIKLEDKKKTRQDDSNTGPT